LAKESDQDLALQEDNNPLKGVFIPESMVKKFQFGSLANTIGCQGFFAKLYT